MPSLTINRQRIDAPAEATILEAAALAGVEIPTLCHLPGKQPNTSCMICIVDEARSGKRRPACAARVEEGMVVQTDNPSIHTARRTVLELLLSEHAGDCEAPCSRICPAGLDIPLMLRCIARGDMEHAGQLAAEALVIPSILGHVCHAPCETGCRRARHDAPIAIRHLHRIAGGELRSIPAVAATACTGRPKNAAIIGAGPAGLAAAWALHRMGYDCHVYERESAIGGRLLRLPEQDLPAAVRDAELERLRRISGIAFHLESKIIPGKSFQELMDHFEVVVAACSHLPSNAENVVQAPPHPQVIREIQSGKRAAEEMGRRRAGESPPPVPYDSNLGAIPRETISCYAQNRIAPDALNRAPQTERPRLEAERCFHCDCHAPVSCKLRRYATEYGVRPHRIRKMERPPVSSVHRHAGVVFETGKCIKCGLCVDLTRKHHEALGLTFIGRGFTMEVGVPFGGGLDAALAHCAEACVRACPTGALAFSNQEERLA